ncbi:MAG: zf-HC2 domain-containing protein [Mobilitalea sp.]
MKITCDVIKDLLPLYFENISSDDTRNLVEEHLNNCENCKKELNRLSVSNVISLNVKAIPLTKIQKTLHKKKLLTILLSVSLTLLIFILAMGYLTSPYFIPYSQDVISITANNTNQITAHIGIPDAYYDIRISRLSNENHFTIELWTSILGHVSNDVVPRDFILNNYADPVTSVSYSSNDGSNDVLLYGTNQNPNGGAITLPRLVLSYYVTIAAVLILFLGIILILVRKSPKTTTLVFRILVLPLSYLLGHLCVKGFNSSSYSVVHDLYTILLATVPIYFTILIIARIILNQKSKQAD